MAQLPDLANTPDQKFFASVQEMESKQNDLKAGFMYAILDYEGSDIGINADTTVSNDLYTVLFVVKSPELKKDAVSKGLNACKTLFKRMRDNVYDNSFGRALDDDAFSISTNHMTNVEFIGCKLDFAFRDHMTEL